MLMAIMCTERGLVYFYLYSTRVAIEEQNRSKITMGNRCSRNSLRPVSPDLSSFSSMDNRHTTTQKKLVVTTILAYKYSAGVLH